jgi:hypothetical protein
VQEKVIALPTADEYELKSGRTCVVCRLPKAVLTEIGKMEAMGKRSNYILSYLRFAGKAINSPELLAITRANVRRHEEGNHPNG